jgi:hypothetical protein
MQGHLGSTHNSQPILSRFSVRSHKALLVILVKRARPDREGVHIGAGTESIKMSRPTSGQPTTLLSDPIYTGEVYEVSGTSPS